MTFRKIPAKEEVYIQVKARYELAYIDFEEFAERLTLEAGNAKKSSGKAGSYARYLMKLIVLYEEIFTESMGGIDSFNALKNFEKLSKLKDFNKYNTNENYFPSATIACFRAYITFKNLEQETIEDINLNTPFSNTNIINGVKETNVEYSSKLIDGPTQKLTKKANWLGEIYPRNLIESAEAKRKNNYTCEINMEHITFINAKDRLPFIEAHHLVPMATQDYFDNTIDFADNIVTLCPNCHRKIHYVINEEKAEMLKTLYERRKDIYPQYGIEIDLKSLKNFYGIL